MIRHLYSKIALTTYAIAAIILLTWGYLVFKDRDGKITITPSKQESVTNGDNNKSNQGSANIQSSENTANDEAANPVTNDLPANPPAISDNNAPVSPNVTISGSILAHITPEHCNTSCQAFANDLKLFEYCEQSCGISPIKNVSNCDNKKEIQKDYCLKDSAVLKSESSLCLKIKDSNILQACKNRIAQDMVEKL